MAKRFTDTEKYNDSWFCSLEPKMKVLFMYMLDTCDCAGIWKENFHMFKVHFGFTVKKDDMKAFGEKISQVNNEIYLIKNFCNFQYGELSEKSGVYKGVMKALKYRGLESKGICRVSIGYAKGIDTLKEQDKDQYKNKDQEKDSIVLNNAKFVPDFDAIWKRYPDKTGKDKARKSFFKSVKTEKDFQDINKALDNYMRCSKFKSGFIQNGSTWFNDWTGYLDLTPEIDPEEDLARCLTEKYPLWG
jgi:hypothetical protein